MATFSVGEALGSGFKLIGRRPFSVFAWGLAYLILAVAPVLLAFGALAPDWIALMHQSMSAALVHPGAPPDMTAMAPMQAKMMTLEPVIVLVPLVGRVVVMGAVFRAVLEPRNSGFAFLRIGMKEVWLFLLTFAVGILAAIYMVVAILGGIAIGGALGAALAAAHVEKLWIIWVEAVLCLALVVVSVWIFLRLSMAFPMTFAEREFRLFESWKLTRGNGWRLLGLAILLVIVAMLIEVVIAAIVGAVAMAAGGSFFHDPSRVHAFFGRPLQVWAREAAPWIALAALVFTYLIGVVSTIFLAPWASAYRQLTATAAAAAPSPLFGAPPEPAGGADDGGHAPPAPAAHDDGHAELDARRRTRRRS